jgi:hypothetical protein
MIWTKQLGTPIYAPIHPKPLPPAKVCSICGEGGIPYYETDGTRSWSKCDLSKHFPERAD